MVAIKFLIFLISAVIVAAEKERVFLPLVHVDGFNAHYHADEEMGNVAIHIYAETTGFVGIGIATGSGEMHNADILIGGCNATAEYFGDYFGEGNTITRDTIQNGKLLSCKENVTHTEIEFQRDFDTKDTSQDRVIPVGEITVIWSLGVTDDVEGDEGHGETRRGSEKLTIRAGAWSVAASATVILAGVLSSKLV